MENGEYEITKKFEVSGKEILSEIVKDEETPEYRAFHFRTSCQSLRWGTRTVVFSLTCYNNSKAENALDTLERHRSEQAKIIVKIESGEIPEISPSLLGILIQGPTGRKINTIAQPDLSLSPSLLSKQVIEFLELEPFQKSSFQERLISAPLFKITISFGKLNIETMVAPSEHGSPACILGGDFFQKVLRGNQNLIQEMVMPDEWRALASAARCKKRHVLIAGQYGENRPRLERIKKSLSSLGFTGLILDEYPDIEEQSLPEKMVTYASICRFVIADDFLPSGHIEELSICSERRFVTAILRSNGRASTTMQASITDDVSFMREFSYALDAQLETTVLEAARWAHQSVTERAIMLNHKFSSWRGPNKMMGT